MDVFDMEREQLSAASTAGNRFKDIFVSTHQIHSQSQIDWSHLHQMEISSRYHHHHHCLHHLCHHHHHCDYPHHYHHNLCHQSSINVQICRVAANPSLSDREHTLKRGRWQGLIFLFGKNMRGRFSLFFSFLVKISDSSSFPEKDYYKGLRRESLSSFPAWLKPNFTCWDKPLPLNWVSKGLLPS